MTTEAKPTNGQPQPGPSSPLVQQPQQFAQGFSGMATEPFPKEIRDILAETPNHEDVQIRPDGIVFMPGVWWRRQLTRPFGQGGWALAPRGPSRSTGKGVEYHGALYCLGRWVSEAVGGCESGYMSHADMVESARTDCLGKCCKDLGMASELWEKDWREAWQNEYAVKDAKGWHLKEKRAPKAADLMRDVPSLPPRPASPNVTTAAPSVDAGSKSSSATSASASEPTAPTTTVAPSSPPVDPITANARKAVKGQMKRLGFSAPEAKTWLTKYFGVAKVDMLDDEGLDNSHSLLVLLSPDDQDPPAKYVQYLDNLFENKKVLAKS